MSDFDLSAASPSDYDFPSKFTHFRAEQIDGAEFALNNVKPIVGLSQPAGCGKSVTAMLIAAASSWKTVILTATKGLQAQYLKDFGSRGLLASPRDLIEIKGKSNYSCREKVGSDCRYAEKMGDCDRVGTDSCTYRERVHLAQASNVCVTNYAYWVQANRMPRRGGAVTALDLDKHHPVELLILDEAHHAVEALAGALKVVIYERWFTDLGLRCDLSEDIEKWATSAEAMKGILKTRLPEWKVARAANESGPYSALIKAAMDLQESLEEITLMRPGDWICTMRENLFGKVWEFDCVWPGAFAKRYLLCGVKRVVLMSATLRGIVFRLLNITPDRFALREWAQVYPPNNTPIMHIPTVRVGRKTTEEGWSKLWARIDEILGPRIKLGRKGLIHTSSYKLAREVVANSRYASWMVSNTNDPESPAAAEVADVHRKSKGASVLVSPSFSTGWDFPGKQCEFIIVVKLPYPDISSPVMRARVEHHPQYVDNLVMQDFIQSCYRGSRSPDDRCEVFVLDDMIKWFMAKGKGLAPSYFNVRTVEKVPPPLQIG